MPHQENSTGSGGMCCIRGSLVLFNAVALLAGLATLSIGLWLIFQDADGEIFNFIAPNATPAKFSADLKLMSIILVSIGSLVTFVSVIGCTGACVKSRCLLMSYLLTVTLILALQIMVAVLAFLYRESIGTAIRDEFMSNLKDDYQVSKDNTIRRNWDVVQFQFHCCGVDSYTDWYNTKAWTNKNYVPDSCCIVVNNTANIDGCGRNENPTTWYQEGCLDKMQSWFLEQLHIIASVALTLIFLQLYGIIASILLFFHSKNPKPKNPQYKAYLYERTYDRARN